MRATQQTESPQATPEQLLTLLDLQISAERAKRTRRPQHRVGLLVSGIVVILAIAGVALIVAQGMIANLPEGGNGSASSFSQSE